MGQVGPNSRPAAIAACAGPAGQREARWSGELPECLYGRGAAPYGAIPRREPMLDKKPGRHGISGDASFTHGWIGLWGSLSHHAAEEFRWCQAKSEQPPKALTQSDLTLPASTRERPAAAGPLPTAPPPRPG